MAKKKPVQGAVTAKARKKTEAVPGSDVPTYYVNNIQIDLSTFDVRMRLGQLQGATETAVQVKELAYVFMSHSHFRALVNAIRGSAAKLAQLQIPAEIADTPTEVKH